MNNLKEYMQIAKLYVAIKWEMFKVQVKNFVRDESSRK